ncbi:MAG: hypothetical protein Pg6C_18280 [Treponemataceae bacterium]|nr:MAG: hypothetical protein Pg6C_18280 [Treponemataceae bacterium]
MNRITRFIMKLRQTRRMKKEAAFVIGSLGRLCAAYGGGGCAGCPVDGSCSVFLSLLSSMPLSIRTGDNIARMGAEAKQKQEEE